MGKAFPKFAVMRRFHHPSPYFSGWIAVGPGLPIVGVETDTFEEALDLGRDRIRQYRVTK